MPESFIVVFAHLFLITFDLMNLITSEGSMNFFKKTVRFMMKILTEPEIGTRSKSYSNIFIIIEVIRNYTLECIQTT